jgi:MOSC domain-containing protein YiiM
MVIMSTVLSVNVGRPRSFDFHGQTARSAIWKTPVEGRVAARGINLAGDEQADRTAHGGFDKAVYAYAIEDIEWWEQELGRELGPGAFGENLTLRGVDANGAVIGERWQVGTAELEVSEPRVPCWRLGVRMGDELFPRRFTEAGRPGPYLRIVSEGELGAGDEVRVIERPAHGVTVSDAFSIYTGAREKANLLLTVPQISDPWRQWALRMSDARA